MSAIALIWVVFVSAALSTNLTGGHQRPNWVTYAFLGNVVATSLLASWARED
ncbi:hypothetical protein PCI56_27200 [Plesiomonas shigelloides subsp. oncorhynchi]|nr:hypothetical protein [Plesiomonas shigelloides]